MDAVTKIRYLDKRIEHAEALAKLLERRSDERAASAMLAILRDLQEERRSLGPLNSPAEVLEVGPSTRHSSPDLDAQSVSPDAALLAWAAELAEQDRELPAPVKYTEAPLREVATTRVSWYAAHYLNTITMARLMQRTAAWGICTAEWWREREAEALGALAALRRALTDGGVGG